MNLRAALLLGLCLIACCVLLRGLLEQRLSAQAPPRAAGQAVAQEIGRYQAIASGPQHSDVVVIDTTTGQVWRRTLYAAQGWVDMASPVDKRDRRK
jgi:hypothetical protein